MTENQTDQQSCARCKSTDQVITFRKEFLCRGCFARFLSGKLRFHLDQFKVTYPPSNDSPPLVGIACSFGSVSLTLLSLVNQLVADQMESHHGRTGFRPMVIFVDESSLTKSPPGSSCVNNILAQARQRFPLVDTHVVEIDDFMPMNQDSHQHASVSDLLQSLASRTSRQDVLSMIRRRLLAQTAAKLHCKTLLFGICATKIAEMAISNTAKGRGYQLPFILGKSVCVVDKDTVVDFVFPLCDVLSKEARLYIDTESLHELIFNDPAAAQVPTTARAMSIDELVKDYFHTIQSDFPSIVFTVGRTIAKLGSPKKNSYNQHVCNLCGYPCDYSDRNGGSSLPQDWLQHITVSAPPTPVLPPSHQDLCYGCLVTLRGSNMPQPWIHNDKQTILDTYLL